MKSSLTPLIGGAALVLAGLGLTIALRDRPGGIGWLWNAAFGPVDQGPVDFATLTRRSSPNDALACRPDTCTAKADIVPPVYGIPAAELRTRLTSLILSDGNAEQVARATGAQGDRFVVRTPLMRFPDTVDVLVLPLGEHRATLALYSRSLLGRGDLGANRRRLERWLSDPLLASAAEGASLLPLREKVARSAG